MNIPVNIGGTFLTAGNSATGSFGGLLSLGTGSLGSLTGSQISALKYINGYTTINPGPNSQTIPAEATISTPFLLSPGNKLELLITSCSLSANSAPVFLYT